jgi:hypothetical protein
MTYNSTALLAVNYARALLCYSNVRIVLEVYHLMFSATDKQTFLLTSGFHRASLLSVTFINPLRRNFFLILAHSVCKM